MSLFPLIKFKYKCFMITYLPQNKMILYNSLNLLIGPYISVKNLARKFLRILNIYK